MQEILVKQVKDHIQLSSEEETFFLSLFAKKKIKRKHILVHEGEVNKYSSFVISGILRLYSIDKNGFEHIIQFAPAGWWIGDISSLLSQKPGNLYIDAIEDSEILQILKLDIDLLYTKYPKFERYFRILAENALGAYQQRSISNLSLPAKERYLNFCSLYPSLVQHLPQKYVAAYIGVTPEFLSKMLSQPVSSK